MGTLNTLHHFIKHVFLCYSFYNVLKFFIGFITCNELVVTLFNGPPVLALSCCVCWSLGVMHVYFLFEPSCRLSDKNCGAVHFVPVEAVSKRVTSEAV